MPRLLKVTAVCVSLAYPFIVYWGSQAFSPAFLLPVLLFVLGLRWIIGGNLHERRIVVCSALMLLLVMSFWGYMAGLKFYPVLMNLGFLTVFAGSLFSEQTVVERIARIREPDLSSDGVRYTRKVTQVWCGFFLANGLAAALTALYASDEIWLFYNGFLAYILIATLASVEWLVRKRVKSG